MRILIFFFLILIPFLGTTQIVFNKTSHDFEEINGDDIRFVDIYIKNKTNKEAYILSIRTPMNVEYIQKNASIKPDSSAVIRFYINKVTKGGFDYTIPVFTSDKNESTPIYLKGRIVSLPSSNNLTSCPTFNQKPAQGNPMDFLLTVKTIDKATGEKLGQSKVAILQNGNAIGKWSTENNGQLKIKLPLGITYFYATHKGYYPAEAAHYINFKNNLITLALTQKEEEIDIQKEEELIVEEVAEIEEIEVIEEEELIAEEPVTGEENIIIIAKNHHGIDLTDIIEEDLKVEKEEAAEVINPKLEELDKNNFDPEHFKPINVVFVVDVSYSMNSYGRKDLLKYSLDQLLAMLRPEDKIGLVSYASDAQVILPSTTGDKKEKISEIVKNLKISGSTAGGKGIKLGYKQVSKNMIKDGQNHLMIITDGAFNKDSGNYKRFIKKNLSKKNITMSVVGIVSNKNAQESMREAAELGNGRFVHIERLAGAQSKLKQEVRLSTFKHN